MAASAAALWWLRITPAPASVPAGAAHFASRVGAMAHVSPDGTQVAFGWYPEGADGPDV